MIVAERFTDFNRTDHELEELWLFSCAVAGKTADTVAKIMDRFLNALPGTSPFDKIRRAIRNDTLRQTMVEHRVGMYAKLERCFAESLDLDLRNDPVERFELVHGVGPKTARMFLLHSRPNQNFAALDTHILKHLRAKGIDAPKMTPAAGPTYRRLEIEFIKLAKKARMTPTDYDLRVWKEYRNAA